MYVVRGDVSAGHMAFNFHHPVALSRCAPADRRLSPGALAHRPAPRHATQRVLCVAHSKRRTRVKAAEDGRGKAATTDDEAGQAKIEGASTDLKVVYDRLVKLALPYWMDSEVKVQARWRLAAVVGLTIGTTGVSVLFNFLGRDFFNALSEKNAEVFTLQIFKYLGAFVIGIPVFVYRDYLQSKLALEWRQWMTEQYMDKYLQDRTFYRVQACSSVDNPDQRISSDIAQFTETQLLLVLRLLNAAIDLVSFSGILYSIYPPLFLALILYASGGTYVTLALGRPLIGLNFQQEAREADYRFGLVRLRENAESIAFYGGEAGEQQLLRDRLGALVRNYAQLLVSTRNLDFFTSFYRFLIQVLPAAVIAPLFFQGKIEFGVINQSQSAFNHILTDVSLVVYQFETLAGFTAVLDRLGQFSEVLEAKGKVQPEPGAPPPLLPPSSTIALHDRPIPAAAVPAGPPVPGTTLLELEEVSLWTPDLRSQLLAALNLQVAAGSSLLVEGPSGAGKTSLLRAVAGLWTSGSGTITRHGRCVGTDQGGTLFFVPQRPYMVLGTLRDQLLYPCWASAMSTPFTPAEESPSTGDPEEDAPGPLTVEAPVPDDARMREVMQEMQLGRLLEGLDAKEESGNGLDRLDNWSAVLSLGEQQRLAMCRVLLVRPHLVLMDESTSAMDLENEALVYEALHRHSITAVSVGHRDSLRKYHSHRLRITPGASAASGANGCSWTLQTDTETDGEAVQQSTSALSQPASSPASPDQLSSTSGAIRDAQWTERSKIVKE